MNNLSWMIYLADVCTNLGWVLAVLTVIALGTAALGVALFMLMSDDDDFPHGRCWKIVLRSAVLGAVFGVLTIFTPSQKTVYLIAASQAGELVTQLPEAKVAAREVYDAILAGLRGLQPPKKVP